ncbi:MAG: sigma-70 family RNA polymerase sigma factor, partial [Planctomycetota bacterium]
MTTPPETRHSLLVRLRDAGDQQAWDEFVDIYQPLIYRLARSRGLQDADAREVVQEVYVSVAGAIDRFRPGERAGGFRAWLMRVTKNQTLNLLRKRVERPQGGDQPSDPLDAAIDRQASPAELWQSQFDQEHRKQLFLWAAEKVKTKFSAQNWEAFHRTCVEDESIEQVACE